MNYRIETITQHGNEVNYFYAIPEFSNQEKLILATIGKSWFDAKRGEGLAEDYRCKFVADKNEIFIYALGNETIHLEAALNWAKELYQLIKKDLEDTIDQIYIHSFAIKCLQNELFSDAQFNENFIKIYEVTRIRKMIDHLSNTSDTFLVPTVKDMNNIQVKLREDVTDLQSNLSKVAANVDYYTNDLKERSLYLNDRIDKENQKQETLNWDYSTRLEGYDDWVEKTVKPKLSLVDTLNLEQMSLYNRVSMLEKEILILKTPWYLKLWNFITFHWERM